MSQRKANEVDKISPFLRERDSEAILGLTAAGDKSPSEISQGNNHTFSMGCVGTKAQVLTAHRVGRHTE